MKSIQQHTTLYSSLLVILSGIVFCTFIPLDKDTGLYEFSYLFQHETEFDSAKDGGCPEENDATNPNSIFELVFKKTAEDKHSSPDTNGLAVTRQALNYIEIVAERFYSEGSFLYKSPALLSKEYSSDRVNHSYHHFSATLLSLTGTIAINAP
ncbi:MAG: hypothetical protein ABR545_06020 [Cyclonatronaceae bacterium]